MIKIINKKIRVINNIKMILNNIKIIIIIKVIQNTQFIILPKFVIQIMVEIYLMI